jgi:hypothetical protein
VAETLLVEALRTMPPKYRRLLKQYRNRVFRSGPYIDLFADVTEEPIELAEPQPTLY